MNSYCFNNFNSIYLKLQVNYFICKRFLSHVNPFETANVGNPLKKKKKPQPVTKIENESRIAERICITVLGNGGIGQPRCVGLFTDLKGYLFNCGEGVGRFCREYDINMCGIKHIFITEKKWNNLSGVPDILLTNRYCGVTQMSLHGPSRIEHFEKVLSSMKSTTTGLNVKGAADRFFIDHTLKVHYVPIVIEDETIVDSKYKKYQTSGTPNVVFSYICKIFEKPGNLLLDKCIEHKVPLGPELLTLKSGKSVTLSSGQVIHPNDVCSDPLPGTTILVVDCPSEPYLEAFVTRNRFKQYQLPSGAASSVSHVFHFTPQHIFSSPKYQNWLHRFHKDTQHFVLNSENPTASSVAIHKSQKYFQMLHSGIFSSLKGLRKDTRFVSPENPKILRPPPMLQLHLRPENKFSWTNVVDLENGNEEDGTEPYKSSPEFYEQLGHLKKVVDQTLDVSDEIYPEVVFLGTSSSTSTANRNVSAILVNTSPSDSILLDCGEGAVMQFSRYYGDDIYEALSRIFCIFISHKHTDHYMGMFHLISERAKAFDILGLPYKPVVLILPHEIEYILNMFGEIFEKLHPLVRTYNCYYFGKKRENVTQFLNGIELLTVQVKHCRDAHGIVLQSGTDWKIVYSGDCAPSQRLIDAGKDCTVLIHEASIEDGLVSEALMKKHSTPSQVIDLAEKMNAKYTIATHFSKRYLNQPVLPESGERPVTAAFDFMRVQMRDWPLLPLFTPVIKCLFKEQIKSHLEKSSNVASFEKTFLKVLRS